METFRNTKKPKLPITFTCDKCCFETRNKKDYNRHLLTRKHIRETSGTIIAPSSYVCDNCCKQFNTRSGLWKHRNKCKDVEPVSEPDQTQVVQVPPPVDSSLVIELLKQNQEFKEMMVEQHKRMVDQQQKMTDQQDTIIELSKNTGNTTNNNTINNTTNNKFNLNVFLNETCKDAINLNDFIQSIVLSVNDFINTGEVGYVRGISDIMLERIRDMHPHVRPIHCTDLKRETVYVKDSDVWAKEDEPKKHLSKAVRIVANKNKAQVHPWIAENPKYDILDTPECDKFFEYSKASLGGYGKEEDEKFEKKIISNILKETVIDKNLLE
tara:strand:- start:2458 stop:3432 length:975 start_codon:yes stop_codon:yes gene_type:complete